MARFFIDRPIFAWVIAIVVMIAGTLSILQLPIAQYPAVAPPIINVRATFPGASAKTLEETVTQVIEQRMTGLDGLRYISSSSDATGFATIELTFEPGTNPDIAQVQVQNKLSLAMPQLPQEVQRQGVTVAKANRNFLMIVTFASQDGSMVRNDITDYVASVLVDPLSRVPGVGEIQAFGTQYAMRIFSPDRLPPISDAARRERRRAGAEPLSRRGSSAARRRCPAALNATITAQTRLQTQRSSGHPPQVQPTRPGARSRRGPRRAHGESFGWRASSIAHPRRNGHPPRAVANALRPRTPCARAWTSSPSRSRPA